MNSFRTRVSFAILTAATGALILAGCSNSPESAPAPAAPPAPVTTPSTSSPAAASVVDPAPPAAQPKKPVKPAPAVRTLGPDGYGKLKLGMSYADVKAAGFVRKPQSEGCGVYELYTDGKLDGWVHISSVRGVEAISPKLKVSTPEGMEIGWSLTKVQKAYPDLDVENATQLGRERVGLADSASRYRIGVRDGAVSELSLEVLGQDCYE